MYGNQAAYPKEAFQNASAPQSPVETVGDVLGNIKELAQLIYASSRTIADTVSGSIPEGGDCTEKVNTGGLLNALREIRGVLNNTLDTNQRACRALGT